MRHLMIVAVLAIAGCATPIDKPSNPQDHSAAAAVEVAVVVDTLLSESVTATGMVMAKDEASLSFKIGGVIESVAADVGDVVRGGQVLATLALPEIASVVAKAEAGLAKAERDLARTERLYRDSVVARERVEDAATGRDLALADLTAARFNAQYAVIRARARGTILRRLAEPGQVIGAGMPVVMIAGDAGGQVVRAGIIDRDVARLSVGDRGTIRVATHTEAYSVRVRRIGSAAAAGAGTYPVEFALDRAVRLGGGLASGLVAEVTVTPSKQRPVRLVPIGALLEADADSGWVISLDEASKARRHRVQVGGIIGEWVTILGGLDGVSRVVSRGAAYLAEGEQTRVAGGDR